MGQEFLDTGEKSVSYTTIDVYVYKPVIQGLNSTVYNFFQKQNDETIKNTGNGK